MAIVALAPQALRPKWPWAQAPKAPPMAMLAMGFGASEAKMLHAIT